MFTTPLVLPNSLSLPSEQIQKLRLDKFGRIWLATPLGLSCYDGNRITSFDKRTGMNCQGLRTLSIDFNDLIWIGSDQGIEGMSLNGESIDLSLNFKWIYGIAQSISHQGLKTIVGTSHGLLVLKRHNGKIELSNNFDIGLVKEILEIDDQSCYVLSSKKGLLKFDGVKTEKVNIVLSDNEVISGMRKTKEGLYLVTTSNGFLILNIDGSLVQRFVSPSDNKAVTDVLEDGDHWWVALGKSLLKLSNEHFDFSIIEEINIGSQINELLLDEIGNVWIASNSYGLLKISTFHNHIKQIPNKGAGPVMSIKPTKNKEELILGGDGFIANYNIENELKDEGINATFPLDDLVWNTVQDPLDPKMTYVATQNGLFWLNLENYETTFNKSPILNIPSRVFYTRGKEVFLGTISGLYKLSNGIPTQIFKRNNLKFGYVYCLGFDKRQQLLVGTLGEGLFSEGRSGFTHKIGKLLKDDSNIYAIATNSHGEIAVVQDEKVILIEEAKNQCIHEHYPLAGWSVKWIHRSRLVIGSNEGLVFVDTKDNLESKTLAPVIGKNGWQFTTTNALYAGKSGLFYCGTTVGLLIVDFKKLRKIVKPIEPKLNEIFWHNTSPNLLNDVYNLETGKWSFTAEIFTAWFLEEENIEFQYKLIGFDGNWSDRVKEPWVKYNSLPAGNYELVVRAYSRNVGSEWKLKMS